MNTNKASTVSLSALTTFLSASFVATLFSANISMATEPYDVDKYGPQEPIIWATPSKSIFTHKTHTMDAGLACDDCHDGIFPMEQGATEKNGDFTMKSFKEGKYCGTCHDGSTAFESTTQCGSCHFAPEAPILFTSPVKAVAFDHSIHLQRGKLACETCHKEVFAMKKGSGKDAEQTYLTAGDKRKYLEQLHNKYCGTCHDASQAFGNLTRCTVCHIGAKGYDAQQNGNQKKVNDAGKNH